jgi:hypothetical protein
MKRNHLQQRLAAVGGSAAVGVLCGGIVVAFARTVSESAAGVAVTVAVASLSGAMLGRWPGAVVGALAGGLVVGLAAVVVATAWTVALAVAGSGLLAGWLRWRHDRAEDTLVYGSPAAPRPFAASIAMTPSN